MAHKINDWQFECPPTGCFSLQLYFGPENSTLLADVPVGWKLLTFSLLPQPFVRGPLEFDVFCSRLLLSFVIHDNASGLLLVSVATARQSSVAVSLLHIPDLYLV